MVCFPAQCSVWDDHKIQPAFTHLWEHSGKLWVLHLHCFCSFGGEMSFLQISLLLLACAAFDLDKSQLLHFVLEVKLFQLIFFP